MNEAQNGLKPIALTVSACGTLWQGANMEYLNITAQWRLDLNFGTAEMKVIKHIIWQQGGENYKKKHQCRKCGIACYCMVLKQNIMHYFFFNFTLSVQHLVTLADTRGHWLG